MSMITELVRIGIIPTCHIGARMRRTRRRYSYMGAAPPPPVAVQDHPCMKFRVLRVLRAPWVRPNPEYCREAERLPFPCYARTRAPSAHTKTPLLPSPFYAPLNFSLCPHTPFFYSHKDPSSPLSPLLAHAPLP